MSKTFWIGAFLLAVILGISFYSAYQIIKPVKSLPIYGQNANGAEDHTISNFQLTDQTGRLVTNENVKGKIYVADFFFTTCHGICPKMTTHMQFVYEHYKNNKNILFLSHTVNPEYDSVAVLATYAKKHGAEADQWLFLTGDKKQIYELARKSYLVDASEGNGGKEDFVHTQNFALVDKSQHIRGYYDGTDSLEINKLIEDISILLKEK